MRAAHPTLGKYRLGADGRTPEPVPDLLEWAEWFETADLGVAEDRLPFVRVQTFFLGVDYGHGPVPILFETRVSGGPHTGYQERYPSWDAAEAGHARVVKALAEGGDPSVEAGMSACSEKPLPEAD